MMYGAMKNYTLRTALHNLVFLRDFMEKLRESMRSEKVSEFLISLYGNGVIKALRAVENA
jgi:queuine/archaeosine tRNA-ribosyltransferase